MIKSKGILLLLLFISLVIGCSNQESPETVVKNYQDSLFNSEYKTAYQYLSSSDQGAYNLNQYTQMMSDSLSPLVRIFAKKSEYSVESINTNDTQASVIMNVKSPDLEALMGDFFLNAFSGNMTDTSKIEENITKMVEDGEVQYTNSLREFELIMEEGSWKVFEDLETRKKREEISQIAESINSSVKELIANQEIEEAKEKIEELDALEKNYIKDSVIKESESLLSKIDVIENLELYEVESRFIDTYFDGSEAGVRFKIRNNSDEDLSKVEVTVFYLNGNGEKIYQKAFNPVLVSEYSFGNNEPLRSGYIYQIPEDQYYTSDSVPNEWDEGRVSVSISDIEIME